MNRATVIAPRAPGQSRFANLEESLAALATWTQEALHDRTTVLVMNEAGEHIARIADRYLGHTITRMGKTYGEAVDAAINAMLDLELQELIDADQAELDEIDQALSEPEALVA